MKTAETFAAVVVTFNRKVLLAECLHGLLRQTLPVDAIFVIDNASTDGTQAYLRDDGLLDNPVIQYSVLPENLGGAGGFAAGLEAAFSAGYDWIWLMDDDAEPYPDALEEFQPFLHDAGTAALANLKFDTNGNILRYHLGAIRWESTLTLVRPISAECLAVTGKVAVDFSSFIGLMVRSKAVAQIGFPRREFFIHWDDFEYSARLSAAGSIYLVPSSKILHKEKLAAPTVEIHWGSSLYRQVTIEQYAFDFFGIRNRTWTLLHLSSEPKIIRWLRLTKDCMAMALKIVLYERDHRFLRLRLLARAILDAFQDSFNNAIPFETRKELAGKRERS